MVQSVSGISLTTEEAGIKRQKSPLLGNQLISPVKDHIGPFVFTTVILYFSTLIMKKISFPALFFLAFYFLSCGPSQKITSSWVNKDIGPKKKYTSVFVMALSQNQAARNIVETDLANAIAAKGYKVFKSTEYFTPQFSKETAPTKEAVLAKVSQLGCDAIITVGLVDKTSETRYVPGVSVGLGVGYSPFMGYGPGFGFGGYYGYMGSTMYNPGYYTTDKTYFMEANVFDAASEKMIWSAQSEAYDPSTISKFSRDYTTLLMDKLTTDLRKRK